jgi:hypothetical protein
VFKPSWHLLLNMWQVTFKSQWQNLTHSLRNVKNFILVVKWVTKMKDEPLTFVV